MPPGPILLIRYEGKRSDSRTSDGQALAYGAPPSWP
jgi:hypothetical protein